MTAWSGLALAAVCVAFLLGWLVAAWRALKREGVLQARCSGLEAERRAAEERARSVDQMSEELQQAFKALSGDALRSNIDEFLRLASLKMEKFQESARGDLDQRQKAIADLVGPVRESLDKVLGNVQELEKS